MEGEVLDQLASDGPLQVEQMELQKICLVDSILDGRH